MGDPIQIKAITWNLGRMEVSQEAVDDISSQIGEPLPTVLVVSTQEEYASDKNTLQKKLLAKLNEGLPEDEKYELVETEEPQSHRTLAGSKGPLDVALAINKNRVSQAVLVKKPYKLKEAYAKICHDPDDKQLIKSKSIITIRGQLVKETKVEDKTVFEPVMEISVSGGHLDANSDRKRRAHADHFLERELLKTTSSTDFESIYHEACKFQILAGDINERDNILGKNPPQQPEDGAAQTNFVGYGFDFSARPVQMLGETQIEGTYGLLYEQPDDPTSTQIRTQPDPKAEKKPGARTHNAMGGALDRIAFNSGLATQASLPGFRLNPLHYQSKYNEKKKQTMWTYHGSDHLPVVRSFSVTPPAPEDRVKITCNYILRRMPNFDPQQQVISDLLQDAPNSMNTLVTRAKRIMYYDETMDPEAFLRVIAGVSKEEFEQAMPTPSRAIVEGLKKKQQNYLDMQKDISEIQNKIKALSSKTELSEDAKLFLENTFNQLTKCNDLKNAIAEMRGLPAGLFTPLQLAEFEELAQGYIHTLYRHILSTLNGNGVAIDKQVENKFAHLLFVFNTQLTTKKTEERKSKIMSPKEERAYKLLRKVVAAKDKVHQARTADRTKEPPSRHLEKLGVKTSAIAPGDINGGLIYVMDKPIGREEGFVGLSLDSPAYREFIDSMLHVFEDALKKSKPKDDSLPKDDMYYERFRSPLHNQLFRRFLELRSDPDLMKIYQHSARDGQIDLMLQDKVHHKTPAGLENIGMGGLLFKAYEQSCNIKPTDNAFVRINKLIAGSKDPDYKAEHVRNKLYMVKQDGRLIRTWFGSNRTGPSADRLLNTNYYKTRLKSWPRLKRAIATIDSYFFRSQPISKSNSAAIVETISTKIAGTRGCTVQEIDTVEGTYQTGEAKINTVVGWTQGYSDLTDGLAGDSLGDSTNNVLALLDSKGKFIKIDEHNNLLFKEEDKRTGETKFYKVSEDGKKETISEDVYESGSFLSDYRIEGLGESLCTFIALGDRDGLGSKGQNKGMRRKKSAEGLYEFDFYGIDFGNAYKGPNPIVKTLSDDFSFENPKSDQQRYKNYSVLYDNPLREKMKGVYLLAALRGDLKGDEKAKIADDFAALGDEKFAEKLRKYPKSHGGIDADRKALEAEIAKYADLADKERNPKRKTEFKKYEKRLKEVYEISVESDRIIKDVFKDRVILLPSQIDFLDNLEKLTAHAATTRSPDGKVKLNHIFVARENRAPWDMSIKDGNYVLTCKENNADKLRAIQDRLNSSGLFPHPIDLVENRSIQLTSEEFQRIAPKLTEQFVASKRDPQLSFITQADRVKFQERIKTGRTTSPSKPEVSSTVAVEHPIHLDLPHPQPLAVTAPLVPTNPTLPVVPVPQPDANPDLSSTTPKPIVPPPQDRRAESVTSSRKDTTVGRDPVLVDPSGDIKHLEERLKNPEVRAIAKITDVKHHPEISAHPGLQIQFEGGQVIYAKQKPRGEGLQYSARKGLSLAEYKDAAYKASLTAILGSKKPREILELNSSDEEKRRVLQEQFALAREHLISMNRIKREEAPMLSTEVQPKVTRAVNPPTSL